MSIKTGFKEKSNLNILQLILRILYYSSILKMKQLKLKKSQISSAQKKMEPVMKTSAPTVYKTNTCNKYTVRFQSTCLSTP